MTGHNDRRLYRLKISHDLCVGTGTCVHNMPEAFHYDAQRLGAFDETGDWPLDRVREVAELCPMGAIEVIVAGAPKD